MRDLEVTAIDGHLALAGRKAVAWYRLAPVRWNWQPDQTREQMIVTTAARLAALVDRRVMIRVTNRPLSPDGWARQVHADTSNPLDGWNPYIARCTARLGGLDLSEKEVFLGVEVARPASRLLPGRTVERLKLADELAELDQIVAGPGLDGRPATPREIEWLIHRSVALGCPAPDGGDLAEAVDRAEWSVEPYGRTVQVVAEIDGVQHTRHVAVVTVGRMGELGSADPWLAKVDRLPFPVEVAVTVDVLPASQVLKGVQSAMNRVRNQLAHFREHGLDPPLELDRTRQRALEIQAEVESGTGALATRVDGWFRVAVSGVDEAEALARVRKVTDLFSPQVDIVRPPGQYHLAREFIAGEPLSNTAHRRRMPVETLAGGMPMVTAAVGHRAGMYLGYTVGAGGRHAVSWDLHRSMETRERSGLTLIAGGLGSGKSTLVGRTAYHAVLAGVRCTLLDPSGPLARLCELEELAGVSQHIDLLDAAPGTLNPWRIIATPTRDQYARGPVGDRVFTHARTTTAANRRALCVDVLSMLLPSVLAEQADTLTALWAAARSVADGPRTSPRHVLNALRLAEFAGDDIALARHSRKLADFLTDMAELPASQLIFPSGDPAVDYGHAADRRLVVITMRGLMIPKEGSDRRDWSTDERLALPLLHLAAWKTQQAIYLGNRHERKMVALDEVHALTRVGSGRQLINTASRDSRKHNSRVILASQNVADLLEAGVSNLIDNVLIGRTEDEAAQAEALRMLRIPLGVGYEAALGSLSAHDRGAAGRSGYREFVFSDGEGGIERIVFDLSVLPDHVRAALDTTASPVEALV